MRWFKPAAAAGHLVLPGGATAAAGASKGASTIGEIRALMLASVATADTGRFPDVAYRIRCATDAQALWFLRGDLMAVLASNHGELAARRRLDTISDMFGDLLPEGLRPRPRFFAGTDE